MKTFLPLIALMDADGPSPYPRSSEISAVNEL